MDKLQGVHPATRRQIAFDLPHRAASGFEDFIRGAANAMALDTVLDWPNWPQPFVFLVGPAGCGKSHLARIWASRSGALSVDARKIDLELLAAASATAFVVEDIHHAPIDEVGLFHLLNLMAEGGGGVLLTAQLRPSDLNIALADLMSRLRAATLIEIGEPDDDLLEAVLVKLFADRQIEVTEEVIRFAMRRMERSLSSARTLVTHLDRLSLEEKTRITNRLVERALAEMAGPNVI